MEQKLLETPPCTAAYSMYMEVRPTPTQPLGSNDHLQISILPT